MSLPDDDPVYTLKKVMEELDFSGLLACYSDKGRTGYNPIMMYAVVTYANMREYVLLTVLLICVKETFIILSLSTKSMYSTYFFYILTEIPHMFF